MYDPMDTPRYGAKMGKMVRNKGEKVKWVKRPLSTIQKYLPSSLDTHTYIRSSVVMY